MDKLGLEKAKEPEIELPNIHWIMEKAREFQKTPASLTMLKPLTVCITENCGKFLEMGISDHYI